MQGQGKVKLSQGMVNKKHNHKCNYNLMGFDAIEINLEENKLGLSWAQVLKIPRAPNSSPTFQIGNPRTWIVFPENHFLQWKMQMWEKSIKTRESEQVILHF